MLYCALIFNTFLSVWTPWCLWRRASKLCPWMPLIRCWSTPSRSAGPGERKLPSISGVSWAMINKLSPVSISIVILQSLRKPTGWHCTTTFRSTFRMVSMPSFAWATPLPTWWTGSGISGSTSRLLATSKSASSLEASCLSIIATTTISWKRELRLPRASTIM